MLALAAGPPGAAGAAGFFSGSPFKNVVADYGAIGNAIRLTDGVMNSGSGILTSASAAFVSGDVGKAIGVAGAGAAGANIITTIASRQSATQVTCTANASTSVTAQHVVYGADDTAAFQSAITAAVALGGIYIRVPPLNYFIAGALQNTGTDNAQILFPKNPDGMQYTIVIAGDVPAIYTEYANLAAPFGTTNHAVIHSMAWSGGTGWDVGAVFGGGSQTGALILLSNVKVVFQNLIIRTYPNPNISAVNGQNITSMWVDGVTCDCGWTTEPSAAPTHPCVGIAWPQTDNQPGGLGCGNISVLGYYYGARYYENFVGSGMSIWDCNTALDLPDSWHGSWLGYINDFHNLNGIFESGVTTVTQAAGPPHGRDIIIDFHDVETSGGGWWNSGSQLKDPNNYFAGRLGYLCILSGTGKSNGSYSISGGTNLTKTAL